MTCTTSELIVERLKGVIDPEVGLNIVDMGLVYATSFDAGSARIEMTLTTPGCPMEDYMTNEVHRVLAGLEGVEEVRVEIVWSPPWSPDKINRDALDSL